MTTAKTEARVSENLESDELLLPRVESRQIDLLEGLVAQPQVDAVGRDGELEGHGLVGFRHLRGLLHREGGTVTRRDISPDVRTSLRGRGIHSGFKVSHPAGQI